MNRISPYKLFRQSLLLCSTLVLLASCATRMRIPESLDPERLLPAGAMAYVQIKPAKVDQLILPLLEPFGRVQAEDLIKRTDSMVLAIMPFEPSSRGESEGISGNPSTGPAVYAVASGKFPTRSIAFKLNTDRQWNREEPGWVHKEAGFRLALSSQGQILLGTRSLDTFLPLNLDRPHPVPDFWSTAWDNDLAVYIPDPLSTQGMARSLPFDLGGLPLESMLISIRRMDTQFDVYLGFEFDTERTALVFAPLCRLFLYAMARSLWPTQAPGILAPVTWSTQGVTVGALGLRLEGAQLSSLLALPLGGSPGSPLGLTGGSR